MNRKGMILTAVSLLALSPGCADIVRVLTDATGSTGDNPIGPLTDVEVLFINNTPFFASFSAGSFDQDDPNTELDFERFGQIAGMPPVAGDSRSRIFPFACDRVFSVGGDQLLTLIEPFLEGVDIGPEPPVRGAEFIEVQDDMLLVQGSAPALEVRRGFDYTCGSLLIFRFEFDDLNEGSFRIDFEVVLP